VWQAPAGARDGKSLNGCLTASIRASITRVCTRPAANFYASLGLRID